MIGCAPIVPIARMCDAPMRANLRLAEFDRVWLIRSQLGHMCAMSGQFCPIHTKHRAASTSSAELEQRWPIVRAIFNQFRWTFHI